VQTLSLDASCAHNRKEIVMKGFAARLLSALLTAGLVWLPTVVHAGIALNGLD